MNQTLPALKDLSPLCARHDGAMLGFLLFLTRFHFARERFPVFRRRIQQILNGIAADIVLPASHEGFLDDWGALYERLVRALTRRENEPLFRPFALGFGFLAVSMKMRNQTDEGMLKSIMNDFSLPMSLLQRHAALAPKIGKKTSIDDIMSPALAFLREMLLPLDIEPETCFVAMPFSKRFEEQYASVYKPLMRAVGYRTLRAWGGLASESHIDLLSTLIDKSGALLAELTGLNRNVVFELGYAYGRDKVVLPMGDKAHPTALANVHGLAILPYDSKRPKWREELLQGTGLVILQAMLNVAKKEAPGSEPSEVRDPRDRVEGL